MKKILLFFLLLQVILMPYVKAQVCPAPAITSFSPNTGFIGSLVTISGSNFDAVPSNNQVFFGASQATVVSSSFGTLVVKVPVGATYAPITVKNACGRIGSSTLPFNGIFCGTVTTSNTYNTVSYSMNVSGGYQMLSQDMDLDGKPDLLVCGYSAGRVSIARNLSTPGTFNFAPKYDLVFSGATRCIAPGDYDGDGKIDLAVVDNGINGIKIYRNTSTPGSLSFTGPFSLSAPGAYQLAAGDLNNDGKVDLACTSGNNVRTFLNMSSGTGNIHFAPNTPVNAVYYSTGIAIADVDGDGKNDIGTSCPGNNLVTAIRNTTTVGSSTLTFAAVQPFPTNSSYPYRLFVGDFDKDGKIDFTTNNFNGATTSVFRNTSTSGAISFAPTVNLASPGANYRIGVGDANGDGKPDIVTKSSGANVFSVYINTSSGAGTVSFAPRIDYPGQAEVSGVVIADLDGDFVPDISTSGISYNTLRVYRNNSSVTDDTPPVATCKNITVALTPSGTVTITPEMVDNGSSDACGIDSLSIDKSTFNCSDIGPNNVLLTVTDRAGNTSSCTAVVTVSPAAVVVAGQTTVCQGQTVLMQANPGDSYQWSKDGVQIVGATSQTYTATESGNYQVTVTNTGGCSGISEPIAITVNNNPTVSTSPSGFVSLCPPANSVSISASQSSIYKWFVDGNQIPGATGQTLTATNPGIYYVTVVDLFGCSAISDSIVVSSSTPELEVKGNGVAIADGDNSPSTADATDFGATYPSTPVTKVYTLENSGSAILNIGAITLAGAPEFAIGSIALPVSIAPGSSATFSVTFNGAAISVYNAIVSINSNDCEEPVYDFAVKAEIACSAPEFTSCPQNLTLGVDSLCKTAGSYDVVVKGVPVPGLTYTFSGATTDSGSGDGNNSVFNIGVTNVTLSAINICDTATCTFTVTVEDKSLPAAVCKNIVVQLDNNGIAVITADDIDNGSSDECGIASVSIDKTDFNCSNVGENTVVLTVTDVNGNVATCTSIVTVEDKTAPVVVCKDITIQLDSNGQASILSEDINNGSTDSCGIASVSISKTNFDCSNIGDNPVVLTVTDVNGNVATCTSLVKVEDNIAPAAICKNITLQLNRRGHAYITAEDINNGSWDACGISSASIDKNSFDCSNVGDNTITFTVTDVNGNTSTCTSVVTIEDKIAPLAICQNITVQLDNNGLASITAEDIDNGSNDVCGIASLSIDKSAFDCSNIGVNAVILTVTDVNGNVSACTSMVTVEDKIAPSVTCKSISVELNNEGLAFITAEDIDNGSSDACGIASITASQTTFNCSNIGSNSVVLTVTDVNGNVATCTAIVTVMDNSVPVLSGCPQNISIIAQPGDCNPVASWTAPVASDNCSFEVSSNYQPGDRFPVGTTTVTYVVTDAAANQSQCSFDVTVEPTALNAIVSAKVYGGGFNINCNGGSNGEATVMAEGGCQPYTYLWNTTPAQTTSTATGLAAGTYMVTVTDANGISVAQSITLTEPAALTAYAGENVNVYYGYTPMSCTELSGVANGGVEGYSYLWSDGAITSSTTVCPTTSTVYTFTVTDANGCSAVSNVKVCAIDVRCGNGKKNDKVIITHIPAGDFKKRHTLCIAPQAVPSHLAHGDILGDADLSSDCLTEAARVSSSGNHTGAKVELSAYPNPFTDEVTISFKLPASGTAVVKVYNPMGEQIAVLFEGSVTGSELVEVPFNSENLPNGIYICKLETASGDITLNKIVLRR